ncbi:DUF6286 domain-containing protein [Kribbella sp. GL6]|uniref:DUF6286 domain-containing protein n=1 Tax=Kribbella sp. GL6 TaxID=3419765 RepID=UPI003D085941
MAEATAAPGAEPSSVSYGGDRGRLVIAQRAVERIAEITARRHGAVVRRDSVLGRGLPKARAVVAGRRTRIELELAAAWGRPLAEIATEVRQAVTEDVERFTGLGIDRVDVDITAVEPRTSSPTEADGRTGLPAAEVNGRAASARGEVVRREAVRAGVDGAEVDGTGADDRTGAASGGVDGRPERVGVGAGRRAGDAGAGVDEGPTAAGGVVDGRAEAVGVGERAGVVAAKGPVAGAAAWGIGVVGALVLVGVGGVGVAEMLRGTGLLRGRVVPEGWFGRTVVVGAGGWLPWVGSVVIVVGVVLLVGALKPRRRTHLAVGEMVWIRPAAAARLAADSAEWVDSVTAASVVAKRRRLQATVTMFGDPSRVHDEVGTAVADRLSTVTPKPRVRVDLRED